MTGPELVAALQEEPDGKPWERDWIATWEPRPLPPLPPRGPIPDRLLAPRRRWW